MSDPTKAQSKAEASFRLAGIAKTPRARELFKQLGEAYEKRARGELTDELVEQAEAAPSLARVATLVLDAPLVPDVPLVSEAAFVSDMPLVPEEPIVVEMPAEAEVPVAADVPLVPEAPVAPPVPVSESEQFLAVLKAFREDAARGD
jgi:hypothetical protein